MRAIYWADSARRNPMHAWLHLPVFLSIVGGTVAYLVLRGGDPAWAKKCLYLGIALAAALAAMNVALAELFCIGGSLQC